MGTTLAESFADGHGQKSKGDKSANRVVLALTLEELDRPIHCPDGIDDGDYRRGHLQKSFPPIIPLSPAQNHGKHCAGYAGRR